MEKLNNIIVCLDHTERDRKLIENACEISKKAGTEKVIFLNIIKDFNLPEAVKKEFPELLQKAIDERKEETDKLVRDYFVCSTESEVIVKQGSLTKEILKTSTEFGSDLIIMGRKKVSESVLSTRIARRCPCNLLMLPENVSLRFDKVFIPVDFSDYSTLSLNQALSLTKSAPSTIFLQNVYSVPSSYRYSGKTHEEFAEIMKGHANEELNIMTKQVKTAGQELLPVLSLDKSSNVISLIMKEAKARETDLIVMGAKGRTAASALFIGSKAERMIRTNTEIPLLIVRKKGAAAGILETLKDL